MIKKQSNFVAVDAWGAHIDTGTAAINAVLLDANYPLTELEIITRIKERGLKERGAVRQHLQFLKKKRYIIKVLHGFIRVGDWLQSKEADHITLEKAKNYTPDNVDMRQIVQRQIRVRRGQQQFREALCERYKDRCVVTGSEILSLLEAAHINPYRCENDNHPDNGLLLRTDIHTLFDLNLLGIEPSQLRVELHPEIEKEYQHLTGKLILCQAGIRPSQEALEIRYQLFCCRKEHTA
jgi:predicted restriction endonuclease